MCALPQNAIFNFNQKKRQKYNKQCGHCIYNSWKQAPHPLFMGLSSMSFIFSFQKNSGSSPCSREKQAFQGGLLLCLVACFDTSSEDGIWGAVIVAGPVVTLVGPDSPHVTPLLRGHLWRRGRSKDSGWWHSWGLVCSVAPLSSALKTPWTVALGFPRQEFWSGLPFPTPGDLPDPGIQPQLMPLVSPAWPGGSLYH